MLFLCDFEKNLRRKQMWSKRPSKAFVS